MKKAMQQLGILLGKPKPKAKRKAPPAKVKMTHSGSVDSRVTSIDLHNKFNGPPHLVGAEVAWGAGRLCPATMDMEQRVLEYFTPEPDHVLGIAGCGTGASIAVVAKDVECVVHGYDWREGADIRAQEYLKSGDASPRTLAAPIHLDSIVPPLKRINALLALEPILTISPAMADWLRLGLAGHAQLVLEEPSMEVGHGDLPSAPWFTCVKNENTNWMSPGQREESLNRAGYRVTRVRETTGITVRNLRVELEAAEARAEELHKAMEIAPELEVVLKYFNEEVNVATNRLNSLESGEAAVYRYQAIRQRTKA